MSKRMSQAEYEDYYNNLPVFSQKTRDRFPNTSNCQDLDSQLSELRVVNDLVNTTFKMRVDAPFDRKYVRDLLLSKELQFVQLLCKQVLENEVVFGTIDMTQEEFKKQEERIILEANKKRKITLVIGSAVLLLGMAVLIKT